MDGEDEQLTLPAAALLGARVRYARKEKQFTLKELANAVDRAPSLISQIENGKREPRLSLLKAIAQALGVSLSYLLADEAPDERSLLELELASYQQQSSYQALRLPQLTPSSRLSTDALRVIVGLHRQLAASRRIHAGTPEKARAENRKLRAMMRSRDNYLAEIETVASDILGALDMENGPRAAGDLERIVQYLGYTLIRTADLPAATRAIRDLKNRRIYLRPNQPGEKYVRSLGLRSIAGVALGHETPRSFGEFLRQRIAANYFAAAILLPEKPVVALLQEAKKARELEVAALADRYRVRYETAAHRFTNLATRHLGIRLHFDRVSPAGVLTKIYSNDGIKFPEDVSGAVEGQLICRKYASMQAFKQQNPATAYRQYTDTPMGTFFCTAQIVTTSAGHYSIGIGVPFTDSKWFAGRDTKNRMASTCPDPRCCRLPNPLLASEWEGKAFPEVKTHSHLLAALPPGAFPGVDDAIVYEFLASHETGD